MSIDYTTFSGLNKKKLDEILFNIQKIKVALIGDVCLDVYWRADMRKSELSRETPHFPLPVIEEWMSPGAGSNAASNIAALKPSLVYILGVVGKDWRGEMLLKELENRGIDTSLIISSSCRVTNAYCKPLRKGISNLEYEDPRIDFSNYTMLEKEDEDKLLGYLDEISKNVDVICVSDQFTYGCITKKIRDKLIQFGIEGKKVIVDSRDRIALYNNVILKPNELEGYRAIYGKANFEKLSFDDYLYVAKALAKKNTAKVCMTLGDKGSLFVEDATLEYIPSYEVKGPLDTCGAGDTFLSAFSCALAAGAKGYEAASFANIAADVIIKKIGITGTADPEEIRARHGEISTQ